MSRKQRRMNGAQRLKEFIDRGDGWKQISESLWVNEGGIFCGRQSRSDCSTCPEVWALIDNKSIPICKIEIPAGHATKRGRVSYLLERMVPIARKWFDENPIDRTGKKAKAQFCMKCGYVRTPVDTCNCGLYMEDPNGGHELRVIVEKVVGDMFTLGPAPGESTNYALDIPKDQIQGLPSDDELAEAMDLKSFIDVTISGPSFRTALNKAKAHEKALQKLQRAQVKKSDAKIKAAKLLEHQEKVVDEIATTPQEPSNVIEGKFGGDV